jgi:hypothetical protein
LRKTTASRVRSFSWQNFCGRTWRQHPDLSFIVHIRVHDLVSWGKPPLKYREAPCSDITALKFRFLQNCPVTQLMVIVRPWGCWSVSAFHDVLSNAEIIKSRTILFWECFDRFVIAVRMVQTAPKLLDRFCSNSLGYNKRTLNFVEPCSQWFNLLLFLGPLFLNIQMDIYANIFSILTNTKYI